MVVMYGEVQLLCESNIKSNIVAWKWTVFDILFLRVRSGMVEI